MLLVDGTEECLLLRGFIIHAPPSTQETWDRIQGFWNVTLSLSSCFLTFRRKELPSFYPSTAGRRRHYVPSKSQETLTKWHGVISHTTWILNKTAVETQISHVRHFLGDTRKQWCGKETETGHVSWLAHSVIYNVVQRQTGHTIWHIPYIALFETYKECDLAYTFRHV